MAAPTIDTITADLIALIREGTRADLVHEDTSAAIEIHFDPVGLMPLPHRSFLGGECSTDGYYEPTLDSSRPWIFYANDVAPPRVRFTLLHELGHHLLNTSAAHLLDDLDRLGGSAERAARAEEAVCHHFAGEVLVPASIVDQVLPTGETVRPHHVQQLHDLADAASWEAVAVRVAGRLHNRGAIVIVRETGVIAFCAARGLEGPWWPRGGVVSSDGPLARALRLQQTARPDTYRWGLAYSQQLHCDTLPVHADLAIAVLSGTPSDGSLNILEETEPAWKTNEYWCERCNEQRTEGWCDNCHGPYCSDCGRCACSQEIKNPPCPECGVSSPFRPGATMCTSCERDLGLI